MSERLFNQALEDDRAFLEALIKPAAAGRKPTLTLVRK